MTDYSMNLAKFVADIVIDIIGDGITANTKYSSDGNNIIMEFDGYPLYAQSRKSKCLFSLPVQPSMSEEVMFISHPFSSQSEGITRSIWNAVCTPI